MFPRTSSEPHRLIATTQQRSAPTSAPHDRRVFVSVVALAALSVGGAIISVAGGLSSTIWEAMGPTGRLSIPIPMMLAQLAAAWLAAGPAPAAGPPGERADRCRRADLHHVRLLRRRIQRP